MLGVRESLYGLYIIDTRRYLLRLGEPRSRLVILSVAQGCTVAGRARRALHQRHRVPSFKAFGMRRGPRHRAEGFIVGGWLGEGQRQLQLHLQLILLGGQLWALHPHRC